MSILETMNMKNAQNFSGRISMLVQDPTFVEILNSYIRLYTLVLNDMEERMNFASELVGRIDAEITSR